MAVPFFIVRSTKRLTMPTETTTPQTGVTPNPIPANAEDYSGSDNEILDNFADGPIDDTHDDGVPMGLGGEKEKQAEPASSTLEADIVRGTNVNGTTKQPGETIPSETVASEPEPVQDAGEKGEETSPEPTSEEPEPPDSHEVQFPPMLLQMAGLADAEAAKAAGFGTPETLSAYIRGRGELLASSGKPAESSEQPLYRRRGQEAVTPPVSPPPKEPVTQEETAEFKPFQLPAEKMEMLDEDLQSVLREIHEDSRRHIERQQKELQSLREALSERETISAEEQEHKDALQFDKDVQELGEEWHDIFGEGDGRNLRAAGRTDPVSRLASEYRGELYETVYKVRVDAAEKNWELTRQQELLYALMRQFPDKFRQVSSENSSGNSSQRPGVTASRPKQRNTPPKGQDARTISKVDAMLKKRHGYSLDMGEPDELEGEI